jgi:hypothetical protein
LISAEFTEQRRARLLLLGWLLLFHDSTHSTGIRRTS